MTELLVQILSTFALILGVGGGEIISTKAFGAFKKAWMHLIEIILFVSCIVLILNLFRFNEFNAVLFILTYFGIGMATIIFLRGMMTGAGILSEHVKTNVLKKRNEKDYIIGLKKSLERRGFEPEEIIKIAREAGYSDQKVKDVFLFFGYKNQINQGRRKRVKRKTAKKEQ